MKSKKLLLISVFLLSLLLLTSAAACRSRKTGESGSEAVSSERREEGIGETGTEEPSSEIQNSSEAPDTSESEPAEVSASEPSEQSTVPEPDEESTSGPDETVSETPSETASEAPTEPVHVHTLEFTAGVYPSCTEAGHYEYYRCSGCGSCFFDQAMTRPISSMDETVIPATGHKLSFHPATAPDCDEVGVLKAYYECENCGNWYFDEAASEPAENHDEIVTTGRHQLSHVAGIEASCTRLGVKEHWKCAICYRRFYDSEAKKPVEDPEKDLVIEVIPHDPEPVAEVPATCSQEGKKAHFACSMCGALFLDQKAEERVKDSKELVIAATGKHQLEAVSETDATEDKEGVKAHFVCKECGALFLDEKAEKPVTEEELVIPKPAPASSEPDETESTEEESDETESTEEESEEDTKETASQDGESETGEKSGTETSPESDSDTESTEESSGDKKN